MEHIRVAVIGGGQAGLSASFWLKEVGCDHVVFDRGRTGDTWRHRWDSFCLVSPNWSLNLPGFPYAGDDPDGFIPRDAIAAYVEAYRRSFDPPVMDSIEVTSLRPAPGKWELVTTDGSWTADNVVVATGPFPIPSIPDLATGLDPGIVQLHSHDYRNPSQPPEGAVLVVGSAQSGCQIVDDMHLAGREVWLSVSSAGRAPRRYRGHDGAWWLRELGFIDHPIDEPPLDPAVRFMSNGHVSGRDGGKDLNLRAFGRDGVKLVGRLLEATGSGARFSADLEERLEAADQGSARIESMIDEFIESHGIEAPKDDLPPVVWSPDGAPERVDLAAEGISTIVWATGYHLDFSWIQAPVFGPRDYPNQRRGVTEAEGLYFVGLNGLHSIGSGLFWGVGRDAEYVVRHLAAR